MPTPSARPTPELPLDTYLPFMRDVQNCERSLHELSLLWRMVESSAKMNCPDEAQAILPNMAATRQSFQSLEREMVSSLVGEKVGNVLGAIGTQAQYVIDIIVRNLYERTADVGFLATDDVLREFAAGNGPDVDEVRARLRFYRAKYTVYADIVVVDAAGNVLVQTDAAFATEGSTDPIIAQALATDGYVEAFGVTDLHPGTGPSLVYARRMDHPRTGQPIAVLCLVFDFDDEMASIFRTHRDASGHGIMLLVNAQGRVLASGDADWIPKGARVPLNHDALPTPLLFGGREYLVATRGTDGYQGYPGPSGWFGQVMVPVDLAFRRAAGSSMDQLEPSLLQGLLTHARHFSPPLHEVIVATDNIRRVVWNGQVVTAGRRAELHKLKTVLDQVSETGARSNVLFTEAIQDLYQTVLQSRQQQVQSVAGLLVDLLDRNLYERANDCRWWAMTPTFRQVLSLPHLGQADLQEIGRVLSYIHGLYTVYSRLVVYDRHGLILAESTSTDDPAVTGQRMDDATLDAVLRLTGEQQYHVSPFATSQLSPQRPTYVYHAAIHGVDSGAEVVGGIGIVFNATNEFQAMLQGVLASLQGAHAYFTEPSGRVIASTDLHHPVGTRLPVPAMPANAKGSPDSSVVEMHGQYAALGRATTQGYREFKVSDGYSADVTAWVWSPLGEVVDHQGLSTPHTDLNGRAALTAATPGPREEYAVFRLGPQLLAVPAQYALEASSTEGMNTAPKSPQTSRVGLMSPRRNSQVQHFVWVHDLAELLQSQAERKPADQQVVLLSHEKQTFGILVDDVHSVPEFGPGELIESPFGQHPTGRYITKFGRGADGDVLIGVLDAPKLFESLAQA